MPVRPPSHRPPGWRSEAQRKAEFDARRGNASARGYGSLWRRAREAFLSTHPLCATCESAGYVMPATEVDHIIPHRGDWKLFWNASNWQPLCKSCHSRKTAREDSAFSRPGGGKNL